MRYDLTTVGMVTNSKQKTKQNNKNQKTPKNHADEDVEKLEVVYTVGNGGHYGILVNLKNLPQNLVSHFRMYLKELKSGYQKDICTPIFMA